MTIVSPSGREYEWNGSAPPTQADYEALQKHDAELSGVKMVSATPPVGSQTPAAPAGNSDPWTGPLEGPYARAWANKGPVTINTKGPLGIIGGDVVDAGLEGGGAAIGQTAGTALAPMTFGASVPVLGFAGGALGNTAAQLRQMSAGERTKFSFGQMLGGGTAGLVPGGSLAKTGAKGFAVEALKAAAGNVAAKTVETTVDEGRLPTMGEASMAGGAGVLGTAGAKGLDTGGRAAGALAKKIQNSVRDQTLAEAKVFGYVVPGSMTNPNVINNTLESFAGKAATKQEMAARNQEITNSLAMKAVGLPAGSAPLTEGVLEQVRKDAGAPYREIAAFSEKAQADLAALRAAKLNTADPHQLNVLMNDPDIVKEMNPLITKAAADVNALKDARFAAHAGYSRYLSSRDPAALEAARSANELAKSLEEKIEDAAKEIGRPGLVDELKAARTRIAKSYEVERALNLGDANVSAPVLGRSLDRGAPLTGELETIAKTQQAFKDVMHEGASVPVAGVSKLKAMAMLGAGAVGTQAAGHYGALAGLLPLADGPLRSVLGSKPYQYLMATPRYYGTNQADALASYIRLSTQAGGR